MPEYQPPPSSWSHKFACAWCGIRESVRSQNSFAVHLSVALAVIVAAALHRVSWIEWAVLLLCIALVLGAELFNTALEHLARAVSSEHNDEIRKALDASSGAVLALSIGAAVVGGLIFLRQWALLFGWWNLSTPS